MVGLITKGAPQRQVARFVAVLAAALVVMSGVGALTISAVSAERDEVAEALADVVRTQQELVTASADLDAALAVLSAAQQAKLSSTGTSASAARALSDSRTDAANSAAASYVAGERAGDLLLRSVAANGAAARTMLQAVADGRQEAVVRNAEAWLDADRGVREAASRLSAAELDVRRAASSLQSARVAAINAIDVLARAQQRAAARRLLASDNSGTGIPAPALKAYVGAAEWATSALSCDAPWWSIAAVGRHESHHGSYLAVLLEDGSVVPHLFGIPLDGTRSLAVRDTDGGFMDEDPIWDRAMGPMQVLPQTWTWYASRYDFDADGNGIEDPHNINDAARLTAAMLCRNGGDLRTEAGLKRGYWGYNPSLTYNDVVYATAMEYSKLGAL